MLRLTTNLVGFILMNALKSDPKHAAKIGRLGGKSMSDAKQRASRQNGKRGGRPKLHAETNNRARK